MTSPIQIIASGSSGNCYCIDGRLLIEAGIPVAQVRRALPARSLSGIEGCLVSHSHGDHSGYIGQMVEARVPVYVGHDHFLEFGYVHLIKQYSPDRTEQIGTYRVRPLPVAHDVPCHGFLIQGQDFLLAYLTDTAWCPYRLDGITHWMIECNYLDRSKLVQDQAARIMRSHMGLDGTLRTLRAQDLSTAREIVLIHVSQRHGDEQQMVDAVTLATGIYTRAAGFDPLPGEEKCR